MLTPEACISSDPSTYLADAHFSSPKYHPLVPTWGSPSVFLMPTFNNWYSIWVFSTLKGLCVSVVACFIFAEVPTVLGTPRWTVSWVSFQKKDNNQPPRRSHLTVSISNGEMLLMEGCCYRLEIYVKIDLMEVKCCISYFSHDCNNIFSGSNLEEVY